MMQIHLEIRVLLLVVIFALPGLTIAGSEASPDSKPAETEDQASVLVVDKNKEIDRLQQDIAASKAEKESINEQNELLQNKMQELKSRIRELKQRLLQEDMATDAPALK